MRNVIHNNVDTDVKAGGEPRRLITLRILTIFSQLLTELTDIAGLHRTNTCRKNGLS